MTSAGRKNDIWMGLDSKRRRNHDERWRHDPRLTFRIELNNWTNNERNINEYIINSRKKTKERRFESKGIYIDRSVVGAWSRFGIRETRRWRGGDRVEIRVSRIAMKLWRGGGGGCGWRGLRVAGRRSIADSAGAEAEARRGAGEEAGRRGEGKGSEGGGKSRPLTIPCKACWRAGWARVRASRSAVGGRLANRDPRKRRSYDAPSPPFPPHTSPHPTPHTPPLHPSTPHSTPKRDVNRHCVHFENYARPALARACSSFRLLSPNSL